MPTTPSLLALGCCLSWLEGGLWSDVADKLQGSLTLGTYHHFHDAVQEHGDTRIEAKLELEFDGKLGERVRYHFTPRAYVNNMDWATGVVDQEPETQPNRFILDAGEAYLRYSADSFDLSLGRQVYRWSVADIPYNPSDNNLPMDFMDSLNLQKMGVFSGSLQYSSENVSLTLLAIPWFTPSRIPGGNSRWQGDFGDAPSTFMGYDLAVGSRSLPDWNPGNAGAYGFHLASSTLLNGWDLALNFYDGRDPVGVLRGDIVGRNVVLHQDFPRFRETGISYSTTWGNVEFHGEAGFHDTVDNEKDDDYLEYVVGANYTNYSVPFTEETFIVLEYADEQLVQRKSAFSRYSGSGDYVRPFKGTWIASVNFKFDEDNSLKLSGLRNQADLDGLWRADFSHKFNDALKVNVGVDFLDGSSNSFFGRWRNNDRIFMNWTLFI